MTIFQILLLFGVNIIIGADHRGFELKKYILDNVEKIQFIIEKIRLIQENSNSDMEISKSAQCINDIGCYENKEIDFTDIVFDMIDQWKENSVGILICKSGIGMSICVNRFSHIRGAICTTFEDVISAREHNNANVLILGAQNKNDDILQMIDLFLKTKFNKNIKYNRRVEKMSNCIVNKSNLK